MRGGPSFESAGARPRCPLFSYALYYRNLLSIFGWCKVLMFLSVRQSVTKPFVWAIIFWSIDGTRFIFGMHDLCDNDLTLDQVKGQILIKVRSDAIQNVFAMLRIHNWPIWFLWQVKSFLCTKWCLNNWSSSWVYIEKFNLCPIFWYVYGRIFIFVIQDLCYGTMIWPLTSTRSILKTFAVA